MTGYDIRLILYGQTETWRDIRIPKNINFKQFHSLIQKIFGFEDYHNWMFKVPFEIPNSDEVDLNNIIKTISDSEADKINIYEIFDEFSVLLYEYDFGDSWEIIIFKQSECEYNNKMALIKDYGGKYNPKEDIGGVVFDEVMELIEEGADLKFVLEEYGLTRSDLSKMDFEKKYKKGSKIRIN